jgi:hypothetical protein
MSHVHAKDIRNGFLKTAVPCAGGLQVIVYVGSDK